MTEPIEVTYVRTPDENAKRVMNGLKRIDAAIPKDGDAHQKREKARKAQRAARRKQRRGK